MKAAIYVRVSTGLQIEGTSLETQIDMCEKKAKDLGLFNYQVYKDAGKSGEDIDRPAMNELRQDVSNGLISHIICVHPDRLSRNMVDKLVVCGEFEKNGVDLIFVDSEYKNTPEGILFFNMQSAIAQYELSMIRKRTSRGRIKAIESQNKIMPMRVAPFGYDLVDSQLIVNEKEAEIVRKIYDWYVFGNLTLREIGEKLIKLGIPPKRKESKNWHQSSINRILTSEIYIGKYIYNRRKTKKIKGEKTKAGNPKKTYVIRDEEDWIVADVPAIVQKELFDLAQRQRSQNLRNVGNNKYQYLLKGLIRCGHCGGRWCGTTYAGRVDKQTGEKIRYRCYRCLNKNPKKYGEGVKKCHTKTLRAELIEDYVWSLVLHTVTDRDSIENLIDTTTETADQQIWDTISILNDQIKEKEKEREKVKLMFIREVISEEEMTIDMKRINTEIKKIEDARDSLHNNIENSLQNEAMIEKSKMVLEYLDDLIESKSEISFEQKRFIIQSLIQEIILTFDDDNTNCEITCIGHLGNLLGNDMGNSLQRFDIEDKYEGKKLVINSGFKLGWKSSSKNKIVKEKVITKKRKTKFKFM